MTQEELQKQEDLNINVTPIIEDAFYFLRTLEEENGDIFMEALNDDEPYEEYIARLNAKYDGPQHAAERLLAHPTEDVREAVRYAYRMIDNLKRYGVACKEWA